MLSKEYGWTPEQINNIGISEVKCYLKIINTKSKIEEMRMKKANRK